MRDEGPVNSTCRIRVYYPNPLPCTYQGDPRSIISEVHEVSYIDRFDPVYHEVCFTDKKGIRHRILGLACELTEAVVPAAGIDASG